MTLLRDLLPKPLLTEKKQKWTIYCDMDGVLADFVEGFKKEAGKKPDAYEKKQFWAVFFTITKGRERKWWAGLPWMPDGKQLWSYIKKYKPILLTAPPSGAAEQGKRDWAKTNLGSPQIVFKSASSKAQLSQEGAILIDDKKETIDAWNAKGGKGIYHTSTESTLKKLKNLGL